MTENSVAWEKVFERLDLTKVLGEQGICYVTADELKEHGVREPRLMAKMDTLQDRPQVFQDHAVNIFPVRNGKYVLIKDPENKAYFKFGEAFEKLIPREYFSPTSLEHFETFPANRQFNESQAIDFAFVASLLRTFFGDSGVQLTVRGRIFSGLFGFQAPIGGHGIEVNKVQIEVDSGYEGESSIFLIEAKVGKREDFNIRQLYYPFLNWSARSKKRIVPIFLTFTNGQYFLTEFAFTPNFGELNIVRNECYTINDSPIASVNLNSLLSEVPCEAENTPFPQADDMDKVVDLIKLVASGVTDKFQFAEAFEFDDRQGDYYANAAKYLGFLKREGHQFRLTEIGIAFSRLAARAERTIWLARQMAKCPSWRRMLELLLARSLEVSRLSEGELGETILRYSNLNPTTAKRRALTARSWLAWLMKNSKPI